MKIWGLILIYTRAVLPHSGPAKIPSRNPQQRYPCASHKGSAMKWPWHKMQLRLAVFNQGMHKVNKAKQKTSNENHTARRIPCPKAL